MMLGGWYVLSGHLFGIPISWYSMLCLIWPDVVVVGCWWWVGPVEDEGELAKALLLGLPDGALDGSEEDTVEEDDGVFSDARSSVMNDI